MNTAAWIPDLFVERVENDEEWTLFSPDEVPDLHDPLRRGVHRALPRVRTASRGRRTQAVRARRGRRTLATDAHQAVRDRPPVADVQRPCNVRSPQDHVGTVHSSNLCTEITLNTSADEHAVCNLGSVNFATHVGDEGLGRDHLAETIETAMRMLDNVVDLCFYPTDEAQRSNTRHRPIGLGTMGFHDALMELGVPMDSRDGRRDGQPMAGVRLLPRDPELLAPRRRTGAPTLLRGVEVGPRAAPAGHGRPPRSRTGPSDPHRARGDPRLGRCPRTRRRARDAELEHDGYRADGDRLDDQRDDAVHRAPVLESLRQVEHVRRLHRRQRPPGRRPAASAGCGTRRWSTGSSTTTARSRR